MKWTIRNKLIIGFAATSFILIAIVWLNFRGLQQNEKLVKRVTELRSPTAQASLKMLNGINQSLAGLRGWMLLNNSEFKSVREEAWRKFIDEGYAEMKELSKSWTNPENVQRLNKLKDQIEKFRAHQKEIENIANTDENIPAYNMLLTKAAPQALIMAENITRLIDLEANLAATTERKAILGMMADVRGTLGLGLANIRAYLLTGDKKFSDKFHTLWAKNDRRFSDLSANYNRLSTKQQKAFDILKTAREKFVLYPKQMFDLSGNEDWNMANYWLKTKAAPVAANITKNLSLMVDNQKELLNRDTDSLAELSKSMKLNSIILAIIGLLIAIAITIFIVKSITKPIARLNANIKAIAKGDLTTKVRVEGNDEITMATRNMKIMVSRLKQVIGSVISGSSQVNSASFEMSSSAQQMSQGANEQAASIEEVSATMEEMSANIEQSSSNTQETEKIDKVATESVMIAERSGKLLDDIVPDIQKTAVLIAEVSAASLEQSASSSQISEAIDQLNKVTQQNSAVSEELSASSEELSAQADLLKDTISFFKIDANKKFTARKKKKKTNKRKKQIVNEIK